MRNCRRTESPMQEPKHKRVRSYNEPGQAHELTFSCFHGLQLLSKDRTRQWFVEAMRRARRELDLSLWAYVIMPEHVHLLFYPRQAKYEVSRVRTALKAPVARKALRFLKRRTPEFLEKLRDAQPNGEVHYRFWQRGGGYDRNEGRDLVYLWPEKNWHEPPVVLRLIERRDGKKKMFLVTNVLDKKSLSDESAAVFYEMRWGVEVFYRSLKQTLRKRKMLSHSPTAAKCELTWAMFGMWLLGLMRVAGIMARGADPL